MQLVSDVVDIRNRKPLSLAVTTAAALKQVGCSGIYDMWCATEVAIRISTSNEASLTATTGYILRANNSVSFIIDANQYIQAITASGSDTLYFHKVGESS
jgi:hypothetical protein